MTILVTGGAGFIGSSLVDRLLRDGHFVVCVDNFDDFYNPRIKRLNSENHYGHSKYELFEVDVRDFFLLRQVFEKRKIQMIVHLAARAGVRPSLENPQLYYDVNVMGTINLLELAKEFKVPHFILTSSSSVYGKNKKVPFAEDDPVENPVSPYAASKLSCEIACRTYHHLYGMAITILRLFTVYGPRQRLDLAIAKYIRQIGDGDEITLFGDGSSSRDYTFIDDIVDGIVATINKQFSFEIINLGNSQPVPLLDLVSVVERAVGKQARVKHLQDQLGDMPRTFADITKARELLGFCPKTTIEEGIQRQVHWYKKFKEFLV